MKKLFLFWVALIGIGCFTACSNEDEAVVQNDGVPVTVRATIADDADTRVVLGESDGNKTKVMWSEGDKFTLTVNNTPYEFIRTTTGESSDADFTCNDFPTTFPATETITATYPTTEVDYTLQDGSKEKVGDYITLNATREVTEGESTANLNLTFKHNTSVVRMYLTNQDFKDKAVTVSLGATNLLADGTTITTTNEALKGDANGMVEVYLVVPATAIDKNLADFKITAVCDGINYEATLAATKLEAKKLYRVTKDMEKVVVATVTDLSPLVEGETDKYKTANCYLVTGAGDYKFRATHMGNSHADEHALAIDHVAVLWETFGTSTQPSVGDLVTNAAYADGYISFTASENEGNALIAAYNSNDEIVWSWHIWMTDQPKEHTYKDQDNDANNNPVMMDRNIGATSATSSDGVKTLGLLFQWGRKDPFLSGRTMSSNPYQAYSTLSTWPAVTSDETTGTMAYSIQHPTTYIGNANNNWCNSNDAFWASTKSIYDPSPYGWRVPDASVWTNLNLDSSCTLENGGLNLPVNVDNSTAWYPAAGYYNQNLYLLNVSSAGWYWSVTPHYNSNSQNYAYRLNFAGSSIYPGNYTNAKTMAMSVRCMKE